MEITGISGSGTGDDACQTSDEGRSVVPTAALPCRPRKGALDGLHFGENGRDARCERRYGRPGASNRFSRSAYLRATSPVMIFQPLATARVDRDAGFDEAAPAIVNLEHFAGIGPEEVHRLLHAGVAFLGAVTEADDDIADGESDGSFPFPISPRSPPASYRSSPSSPANRDRPGRVEKLPHHGRAKSPFGCSTSRRLRYS